jgi:murein DD-endopeptidase MepM/ murein hydrolase activator NlpD
MVVERGAARARAGWPHRGAGLAPTILLAGLLFTCLLALSPFGTDPALAAKSRGELLDQLEAKKEKLAQARQAIKEAQATRTAALGEVAALDQKIDELERALRRVERDRDTASARLEQTRGELAEVQKNLQTKRAELARTQEDLRIQQDRLNSRAANIYKGGELGYVEVLLSTSRLLDLVNRLDLLTALVKQDEQVLGQIKALKTKITKEKAALQAEEVKLSQVEKKQASQTRKLNALVAEREGTIDQLDDARDAKQAVAEKAEKDAAAWEQQEDQLLKESSGIEAELRKLGAGAPSAKGTGQLMWPVSGRVSSKFGYRMHPISHVRKMHTGLDISAGMGTPIKAADSGSVIFAGWRGGYGKCIIISHGKGLATLYAHQSSLLVGAGRTVGKGEVIGKVGSTGYSTGPHLHFEVRLNGSPVNPLSYL